VLAQQRVEGDFVDSALLAGAFEPIGLLESPAERQLPTLLRHGLDAPAKVHFHFQQFVAASTVVVRFVRKAVSLHDFTLLTSRSILQRRS
jgi:hypothetical protein